jgi:hypothetical protein
METRLGIAALRRLPARDLGPVLRASSPPGVEVAVKERKPSLHGPSSINANQRTNDMMEIEVYTARYEREHGHKPQGKRFWRFILVSQNVTARDHMLVLDQPMIYPMALEKAQEAAGQRKSIRILVSHSAALRAAVCSASQSRRS